MNIDLVSTRRRIPKRQAEVVGKEEALRILSAWGMTNSKKIITEAGRWLRAEQKRRKGL